MAPPFGNWLYPKSDQVAIRLISGGRVTYTECTDILNKMYHSQKIHVNVARIYNAQTYSTTHSLQKNLLCVTIPRAPQSGRERDIYIQSTRFTVPHWGPGGWGTIRRRGHNTLLTLIEHTCVQLAVHMQWGPVSVVCSRRHTHVPVHESRSCIRTLFSPPQGVTH